MNRRRWAVWLAACVTGLIPALWFALPFPSGELQRFPAATVLTDRSGQPLRLVLGPAHTDCRPTYRVDRKDWICSAIVAAEDRRFWNHPGLDGLALLRALAQDVGHLRKVSGASTISTQVIRLAHPRPRTILSKIVEAFRALQMERLLSKEEVLGQYLNRAPFGSNIVGIEAASRRYFAKGPADLSLAEAALLAGLPQSPSRFRPDRHLERARKRQAYVLERMVVCGMIAPREKETALAQPLAVRSAKTPFAAPHFCDFIEPGVVPPPGGGPTRTTLDLPMQAVAERTLQRQRAELLANGVAGAAVVVLDVQSGAVRVMAGSPDFFDCAHDGQVNGAASPRSAGSTLKPFAYALAFDRDIATPRRVMADVPLRFPDYEPENFDRTFRGLVSVRDSLILSLNIPAMTIESEVGQPLLYDTLHALGFTTVTHPASHYGAGLVLGNAEVTLVELANAYACLARGGVFRRYRTLESEEGGGGTSIFSPEACWLIAEALGGEERAADAIGHSADVRLPPLAWKTGTSAGFRDAWTVAFNPQYVIGVWVGNPDGSAAGVLTGKRVAAPIVWEVFRSLYPDNDGPWFARPSGIVQRSVCAVSGCPPGPYCRGTVEEWCIRGVSSYRQCTVHRDVSGERWPPEVETFLRERRALAGAQGDTPLQITSPKPDSAYRLMEEGMGPDQRLLLAATGGDAGALHWFVDDRLVGFAASGSPCFWPLQRGRHAIVCCDAGGRSARCEIRVE